MKLGILSDIHGNPFALKSGLGAVLIKSIDRLLITGDFEGYYFWPLEVVELVEWYGFNCM